MTQTQSIAEGDRIYATESIDLMHAGDLFVRPGDEGTVTRLLGFDDFDLEIEWDAGFGVTAVNSGSVALII
ncbi:MAG: hypothetical protein V4515_14510 [Chloroflexota bacterium]